MPILRLSSRSSARLLGGEEGKGLFTDTDTDTVTVTDTDTDTDTDTFKVTYDLNMLSFFVNS